MSSRRLQVGGNILFAASVASALAAAKWLFPSLGLPGWLPSIVFFGLVFLNPTRLITGQKPCMRCAVRFSIGLGVAGLIHVLAFLVLDGGIGNALFPLLIPLLILPMFLGPAALRQLLGGSSSLRSFFRKARG